MLAIDIEIKVKKDCKSFALIMVTIYLNPNKTKAQRRRSNGQIIFIIMVCDINVVINLIIIRTVISSPDDIIPSLVAPVP
ncbi:hypothetical protein CEXT_76961 [Caerostris extrusa]|uniref:Uncharacterized protein n=1 Tax=Caerostris extrusa TaxID=172846 RepID=A0AAV4W3D7_CAEEX|nr:hypothetical protein CEXT_76961 [Caerostris extrusa]